MVRRRYLLVSLGAATLATLSVCAAAQIFECIDADGKKSYMQSCPAGTAKQREIETTVPPKQGIGNAKSDEALKNQEKAFEQRRQERLKAAADSAEKEQGTADAAHACADAKRRLEMLESGRPSKRVDPDTGDHVAIDEDARLAEVAGLQAKVHSLGAACQ